MAKIRITKPGEYPNKKRYKRNVKINKYSNRIFIIILLIYVAHKENLIELIIQFL